MRVYWDVSKTMDDFADVRKTLIDTLDSRWLPRAGAGLVGHVLVGDNLTELAPGQLLGKLPRTDWSALHEAARDAGKKLADQSSGVGAVVIVSDMILEVPPKVRSSGPELCPGLAMPTREFAGPAFGRCFAAGIRAGAPAADERVGGFYAQALQHPPSGAARSVFVTILATNVELGRAIGHELATNLGESAFSSHLLVDTLTPRDQPSCEWQESRALVLDDDAAGTCKVRCADEGIVGVLCKTGLRTATSGVVAPTRPRVTLAVLRETADKDAPGKDVSAEDPPRAAVVGPQLPDSLHLQIGCESGRAGEGNLDLVLEATVPWRSSALPFEVTDPTARDAFESLLVVTPEILEPISVDFRIDLYAR